MLSLVCQGVLFDLDGTLVDSLHAVNRAWLTFARRHELDPHEVLDRIHGRRAIDSIRLFVDEAKVEAEGLWLRQQEVLDTEGIVPLPGALELIKKLPVNKWGIVTSGTSDVARARMQAAGIPEPSVAVFGEDVENGKPSPDPYLLGAERLGLAAEGLVGFEDTEAGLTSIQSAGMTSIAVGLPHPRMIYDYLSIELVTSGSDLHLSIPEIQYK